MLYARSALFLVILGMLLGPVSGQESVETPNPSASSLLGLLPDGVEKRKFILDCMGCHSLNRRILYPEGSLLDEAGHKQSVEKMLSFSGASTFFPVMSPERDAASTAAFLAEHLTEERIAALPALKEGSMGEGYSVDEWDIPLLQDFPHDLMLDGNGNVLVTGMFTGNMYVLAPEDGSWKTVKISAPGGNPRALDVAANGDWWVAGGMPLKLSRFAVADSVWDHFDIQMYPHSTVIDQGGRVWFNGHFTKDPIQMGYVDPQTQDTVILDVPANEAHSAGSPIPYGLRVGPDGTVWGTELAGNRLVKYVPETEAFKAYMLPTPHSGPRRLDVADDGVVWIPQYAANTIARFDPETETFTELEFPTANSLPYCARVDNTRRCVWISQCGADAIARLDMETLNIVEYPLPSKIAFMRHIDVDQDSGEVWAVYSHSPGIHPKVVRLRLE